MIFRRASVALLAFLIIHTCGIQAQLEEHSTGPPEPQNRDSEDKAAYESDQGLSIGQYTVGIGNAAEQLSTLISAARDIQDALYLASQQHAQLLRDLTALQRGLKQDGQQTNGIVEGGSATVPPEGQLSTPLWH